MVSICFAAQEIKRVMDEKTTLVAIRVSGLNAAEALRVADEIYFGSGIVDFEFECAILSYY